MCFKKLDEIDVSYSDCALGIERYVRGIWALHMYRHHVFRVNLSDSLSQKVNQINASLGITVQSIDLNNYKENYGEAEDPTVCLRKTNTLSGFGFTVLKH